MSKQLAKRNWIFSLISENWELIRNRQIFGAKNEKIAWKIGKGDRIILYVNGTNSFRGIFEVTGDWHKGTVFALEVGIQPIAIGSADMRKIKDSLSFVRLKEHASLYLQGTPANYKNPIPAEDFEIILREVKRNPI